MSEGRSRPRADNAIEGRLAALYDVFVDWPGRLSRELPGLRRRLDAVGAERVLDVGCGTGQHVAALREAGYDAHGADASGEMLDRAAERVGDGEAGFWLWRLGEGPPAALVDAAPFDAITCMGNVWPQVTAEPEVGRAAEAVRSLLRPGGVLLAGLKAVAVRRDRGERFMPLLKRTHEGRAIFFVRFIDFDVPPGPGGEDVCDFHMTIVRGSAAEPASAELHEARRLRVWSPGGLRRAFTDAGFDPVAVSGKLADPSADPTGEDVFVIAHRPADAPAVGGGAPR